MRATASVSLALVLAVAATAAWVGCASDGDNPEPPTALPNREAGGAFDDLVSIDVAPAQADLLAGDTNESKSFTATGHFKDGTTRDITGAVSWTSALPELLSMNGPVATATGTRGGETTIHATAGPATGAASVRVKWKKTVLAGGAPAGSEARFANTTEDPSLAPALVYPLGGALVPPNLPPIEVQFRPAAGTNLFDVVFSSAILDLHVVTPCTAIGTTGGCGLAVDQNVWAAVTSTLAGAAPADVYVRGAGAAAGKSGTSGKNPIQLARDPIKGGLYYFNTKAVDTSKPGIYRYDFATAQVGPFYTAGDCAGCHALSKDGTKMLAPICLNGCQRPMQLAVVDVATKNVVTPPLPVADSDTQTWTPDAKYYVTAPACGTATAPGAGCTTPATGAMFLVDATTNTRVAQVPAGPGAMYPSFSNDGKRLVYARAGTYRGPLSIQKSSLYVLDFDASQPSPAWGVEKALLTSSGVRYENDYHPSFSPDDAWVLFTRSHCEDTDDPNAGDINGNVCDSYNDYTARTWVLPAKGGTPIECARANGDGRNTMSWPKWSPFKSTYQDGDVLWYTVSSIRDYGLRALHGRDASGNPTSGVEQLWLVGFDPKKAAAGADPSFAPVWLPFQDVASSNHIGQWTEAIVGPVK